MKYVHGPVTVVSAAGEFALVKFQNTNGVVPVPKQCVVDSDSIPSEWSGYTIDGAQSSGHQDEAAEGEEFRRRKIGHALKAVRATGTWGMTSKEYRTKFGLHHGVASSAMSNLHKDGLLVKLEEKRDRYGVYVAPEFAAGRTTVSYKRNRS